MTGYALKSYKLCKIPCLLKVIFVQYKHERTQPKERKEKEEKMLKISVFLLLEFLLMYYLVKQIPDAITALIAVILVSFTFLWIKYLRFFR